MEESKELQGTYTLFRATIYVSLLLEFFMYALDPTALDFLGGVITNVHSRLGRLSMYQFLPYSKIVTVMLVIITCIGTKNKKQIEFDARKMVFWPISIGLVLVTVSVFLYSCDWKTRVWLLRTNIWLYMVASLIGTILIHIALDNVSKYFKDGMLKDRFNFENESFEQTEEYVDRKVSVGGWVRNTLTTSILLIYRCVTIIKEDSVRDGLISLTLSVELGLWVLLVVVRHSLS